MDPKERFYRHFEAQATALQDDIANLANIAPIGGERKDASDHVLAGISRLTKEVLDALDYAPARDQMIYTQALKALKEQVSIQTREFGPNSGFRFSQQSKDSWVASANPSTLGSPGTDQVKASIHEEPDDVESHVPGHLPHISVQNQIAKEGHNAEIDSQNGPSVCKPCFSQARDIDISNHRNMHILLPATASHATSTGTIRDLQGCVLDMSAPFAGARKGGAPFQALVIRNISRCLVIAAQVAGPAHITGVRDSVLVVNARQVRMHECTNVTVYLWSGSRPIIEHCSSMRLARIPENYLASDQTAGEVDDEGERGNKWYMVDDFQWLRPEPSPHWKTLDPADGDYAVPSEFWSTTVRGGPSLSTKDILQLAGVPT